MRVFGCLLLIFGILSCVPVGAGECDRLLSDLSDIERVGMQNAVMTGRIALSNDSVQTFSEVLNFVSARYEEEALAGMPLLLSHLLMRTDLSRDHFMKLLGWVQEAEAHFLVDFEDNRSLKRMDRFFEVLQNVNRPRELLGILFSKKLVFLLDEHPFSIGDQDIRAWLGERYLHWKRELLNPKNMKPTDDPWEDFKRDLLHSMDPDEILFARYFLTQFFLNLELLNDSEMWAMSVFSLLPAPEMNGELELKPLDEDETAPMLFDEEGFGEFEEAFSELFEEMEDGKDPSDEFLMSQIETMTTLVHLLGRDDEDQDESKEFRALLESSWDLARESLFIPVQVDEEEDRWLTAIQAAVYWDRPKELQILLNAIDSSAPPVWLGLPQYPRKPKS